MSFVIKPGVWPTMITPFTEDNKVDFVAIQKMVEWYIQKGCSGIFAVCQSSEMFFLSEQEKIDIAKAVVEATDGRIQVIASGHTAENKRDQFKQIEAMIKTGVEACVLISNRLDQKGDDEKAFAANTNEILDAFPETSFGVYECPYPFKRLVSLDFLRENTDKGRVVFLKDTCCNHELIRQRLQATKGGKLKLFNANAATFFDSISHGASGYNGIMANFHPDLYKRVIDLKDANPERAKILADFLTMAAMIEMRIYPVSAKYHMNLEGIPMSVHTRSVDSAELDANAKLEVESLMRLEAYIRDEDSKLR